MRGVVVGLRRDGAEARQVHEVVVAPTTARVVLREHAHERRHAAGQHPPRDRRHVGEVVQADQRLHMAV